MSLPTGNGNGLQAQYFSSATLDPLKAGLSRIDRKVDFHWGNGSPDSTISTTNFSARWSGQVQAKSSGKYRFYTNADDGVRLWVNGKELVDNWTDHAETENQGAIDLVQGQKYSIKMEYYQHAGQATAQLSWSSDSGIAKQVIPQSQLYSSIDELTGQPYNSADPKAATGATLDPAFHDSDVGAPNDAPPDGVPSGYSWYHSAAQPGWGNNPRTDWHSMTAWGQLYAAEGWRPEQAPNTRVQIKNIETWVLSKSTHQWTAVQMAEKVDGSAFASNFGNNGNSGVTVKDESSRGGGTSVTAGNGFNYHFWTSRADIDPNDIAGMYTKFQSRLILDNPNGADDRAQSRYIASAGADYWRSRDADWAADWSNSGGVGGGRFKFVTNDWQNFSMQTLSADELLKNPPPLST